MVHIIDQIHLHLSAAEAGFSTTLLKRGRTCRRQEGVRTPEREKETYVNLLTSCLREISAFNLAAVELRTDRHQHQENKADRQNYEAVDGLWPRLER